MKKFSAILLAVIMMLSMVAMAADATITITPPALNNGEQTGIIYNAYKVFDAVISGNNVAYTIDSANPFYNTIKDSGYFTLTQLNGTTTYIVEKKDAYTADAAKTLAGQLNAVANKTVAGTVTVTGANAATLTLAEGYYLITSTIGDALILDTTTNDTIATKNEYPSLGKTADKTTAGLGDTVTYTITVTIPENASGEIVVHDKMTGLKYGEMKAPTSGVTAKTGEDTHATDCTVEFVIDETTVAAGGTVTIVYTAIVTADTANNEAYLVDGNYTTDTTPTPVVVKNYKLDVFKYTGTDTGLAGAGFVLKNVEGKYYKYTAATDDTAATVTWVENINDATEYKTEENAYTVTFVGLANGTYTLVEKTVPAGYNAAQDKAVTIADADLTGETQVEVENKTGTELPSTGGMGTTLFYVVGSLMMAAAVVVLVAKKKVAAK